MGIFSKKEYVCEKCGKTFLKRINLNGNECDECYFKEENEKKELLEVVSGYNKYAKNVFNNSYSVEQMNSIIEHRERILQKYKNENGIKREWLMSASFNYKKLSDEEVDEVLIGVVNSSISSSMGAAFGPGFFVPSYYEGVIVDAESIFAVGMSWNTKIQFENSEAILCAVFTNDPYIPIFSMMFVGKKGFFEVIKSKKGREAVAELFTSVCPNLTYPVSELKNIKKQIKQEGIVRGNLDSKFVLEQIRKAKYSEGLFSSEKLYDNLTIKTRDLLDSIGYIVDYEIDSLLFMDKTSNRKFWNKHMNKLYNS